MSPTPAKAKAVAPKAIPAVAITNAQWNNPENTSLDCDVSFQGSAALPFTAVNNSGESVVQSVWDIATAGTVKDYIAPIPPDLTPQQEAEAALAAGIQIQSTGTPSLNGAYTISQFAQININAEISSILLNNTFTNGQSTMPYLDATNAPHTFSIAQFKDFATKYAAYTSAVTLYALTDGGQGSLPTQPVTIA